MPDKAMRGFPDGFVWGTATASYQIEGAVNEDGRGPSIWDTFSHTPGRTLNGDTGDVAVDHYHRWQEDLDELQRLGVGAYRFSISWSRILPLGTGGVDERGVQFYSDLVDGLIARGIEPVATLYHWDLPQALEDSGGWTERATAEAFEEYARVVVGALGDRVSIWTTLNEPWCSAFLGYGTGGHAPGRSDRVEALRAAHHLNLAHGLGVAVIRELAPRSRVSVTLNLHVHWPASEARQDVEAARRLDAVGNRIFLETMLEGAYPSDLRQDTAHLTDWSFVLDGDEDVIAAPIDVLGVNYYHAGLARAADSRAATGSSIEPGSGTPWIGCDDVAFVRFGRPRTEMGWEVVPEGLEWLLGDLHRRYPDLELMITENGAAFDDVVAEDGNIHDADRVRYIRDHLAAVLAAIDAGVNVTGYFVWSFLDNFEWSLGYERRFGIVRVDYDTQLRTWKDSARWYAEAVATNSLPIIPDTLDRNTEQSIAQLLPGPSASSAPTRSIL